MEITKLKSDILNHTPEKFYIFSGPEWKIQWIYIQKMAESFGKPMKYIDSVSSIHSKLNNRSFINQSYVYVVRDDSDLVGNENLLTTLEKSLVNDVLILLLTTLDKRTKFYKKYSDKICMFEYMKPEILQKYIQKEIDIDDNSCKHLMEACEYDYGRCLLEIDKIKRSGKTVAEALIEGVIYQPPQDAIFDFVDAIIDNSRNVFYLYEQCKQINESTLAVLSVLYNNTKATLQIQAYTGEDISKGTGLNYFQIQNAKKHTGKRKNSELIYIMELCQKCQEGIVTGTIEEEFVLDYILGEIL